MDSKVEVDQKAHNEIQATDRVFETGQFVEQGEMLVTPTSEGPLGTAGVGPCVVVCAKSKDFIGLAHVVDSQDPRTILNGFLGRFGSNIDKGEIELFLIGGWPQSGSLKRRFLALSQEFNFKEAKFDVKKGFDLATLTKYNLNQNYIDVVIDKDGQIFYGEYGIFKPPPTN